MKFVLIAIVFLTMFFRCTVPTDTNSPITIPTPCGIRGRIIDKNGNPVSGASVYGFAVRYSPSLESVNMLEKSKVLTDKDGLYEIQPVYSGTYNFLAEKDSLAVFIDSITVINDTGIVDIPAGQLNNCGKISGIAHMLGHTDSNQTLASVYLQGTNRIVKPDVGGTFLMEHVPEGTYTVMLGSDVDRFAKRFNVTVQSNLTTILPDTLLAESAVCSTSFIDSSAIKGQWKSTNIYFVRTSIMILSGDTLEILPGTRIFMMGNFSILNYGTLICKGASDSFVHFKRENNNITWQGIHSFDNADSIYIANTIIEHVDTALNICNTKSETIVNKCVIRNASTALQLSSSSGAFHIRNSIFEGTVATGGHLIGIAASGLQSDTFACEFENNILLNSSYAVVEQRDTAGGNVRIAFRNNCLFNTGTTDSMFVWQNINSSSETLQPFTPDTSAVVFGDPQFVNTTKGAEDYHLQTTSPCTGTGVNKTDMGIYSTYAP
jgi:hypothetical protein